MVEAAHVGEAPCRRRSIGITLPGRRRWGDVRQDLVVIGTPGADRIGVHDDAFFRISAQAVGNQDVGKVQLRAGGKGPGHRRCIGADQVAVGRLPKIVERTPDVSTA